MEEQFELEKNKEFGVKWKSTTLLLSAFILSIGLSAFATKIISTDDTVTRIIIAIGLLILALVCLVAVPVLDIKISDKFDKKIEEEKKKKVMETFILYKGKKEEEVYNALKNIVFSETRPTQKEIEKINKITTIFNQLKEGTITQKTKSYEKKVDQYIKNLEERKYLEGFEEKHKQKLENIIKTHNLQLNEEPTDKNIEKMLEKCKEIKNVQKKLGISNQALEDIEMYLQKINGNAKKLKEEEVKTTSSVVNEIIKIAKNEEEKVELKVEAELEDRLSIL